MLPDDLHGLATVVAMLALLGLLRFLETQRLRYLVATLALLWVEALIWPKPVSLMVWAVVTVMLGLAK